MNQIETVLSHARIALQHGERAQAKAILIPIVRSAGAENGEAWWLLAQTLDDPQQQADCYARATATGFNPPATKPVVEEPPSLPWEITAVNHPPADPPATTIQGGLSRLLQAAEPAPPIAQSVVQHSLFTADDAAFVTKNLGKGVDRYAIVQAVMVRANALHIEAERFVREIETRNVGHIARRQLPATLFIGIVGIIGGVVVVFGATLALFGIVRIPLIGFWFFGFGHIVLPIIALAMGISSAWGGILSILRGLRNAGR